MMLFYGWPMGGATIEDPDVFSSMLIPIGIGSRQFNILRGVRFNEEFIGGTFTLPYKHNLPDILELFNKTNIYFWKSPDANETTKITFVGTLDVKTHVDGWNLLHLSLTILNTESALQEMTFEANKIEVPWTEYQQLQISVIVNPRELNQPRNGYLPGDAILWVDALSPSGIIEFKSVLTSFSLGAAPVLFGVHSIQCFQIRDNVSAANIFKTFAFWNTSQLLPEAWASPWNIMIEENGSPLNHRLIVNQSTVIGSVNDQPYARWTFVHRRFGQFNRYVNLLIGVYLERVWPADVNNIREVTIETVFTEVNDDGETVVAESVEDEYEPTLGMVFDVFFVRTGVDTVRSIGVFAAITLLATIWSYYILFFEEE
jgi:hypothetical protein